MLTTLTILPPEIVQYFDRKLLSMCDRWEALLKKILWLKSDAEKKYKAGGRKMRDFEQLVRVAKELYGWKKAEEAYNKTTNKEDVERPIVPVESILSLRGQLGKNIRGAFKLGDRKVD